MALTQLTKIDGGGISTTANYRVGVITASKFVGPFDGSAGNFSGIVTATGANFSGNVSIGGTLTYEDVTNIDSVGIITAQSDIHVGGGVSAVGVGTFGGLDINGDLDVDGHTNLDNVSIAGVATFADNKPAYFGTDGDFYINHSGSSLGMLNTTGDTLFRNTGGSQYFDCNQISLRIAAGSQTMLNAAPGGVTLYTSNSSKLATTNTGVSLPQDLDVDGHTNLDNVSIAGVTTAAGNITISSSHPKLLLTDDTNPDFSVHVNAGAFHIRNETDNRNDFRITSDGTNELYYAGIKKLETSPNGIDITGGLTVSGVSTFSDDVTFVTATGKNIVIDKSANKMTFGDNVLAEFGDDNDLLMHHTGSTGYIKNQTGNFYIQNDGVIIIGDQTSSTTGLKFQNGGALELYHNNQKTAFTDVDQWKVYGRTSNSGMVEIASNQGANNNDRFRIHKTSAASRLTIQNYSTGSWVENIRFNSDGEVRIPTGSNSTSRLSFGGNINIYHDGNMKIENGTGYLKLQSNNQINIDGSAIYLRNAGGTNRWIIDSTGHFIPGTAGAVDIGSASKEIGNVYIADDKKFYAGSDQNISLYHTSSNGINHLVAHPGNFMYHSGTHYFTNAAQSQVYAQFIENNYCELRHSGNLKFRTSATGIDVTGEVAASQDYPNYRPTLDFNFAAQKKLDPRITYQRTGPASFTDEFGKVVIVGDNAPRFDHDPVTRESKGLLVEHSRTNFMKYSDEFAIDNGQTGGNWDAIGGESQWTRVSDTTETKDPTGLTNHASKLTHNSGNVLRGYWYSGAADGAVSKTFSVYLKKATTDATNVTIDIGDMNSTTYVLTDEWKRFSVTTSSGGNGNFVDFAATHTKAFYAWGAQIEAGSYATSYIPTSSAAVTRGADFAVLQKEDFTDAISQTEGTFIAEYDNYTNDGYVLSVDGSGGDKIGMVNSNGYQLMGKAGGVSQGSTDNGTLLSGTNRFALAYKTNDAAISINGNTATVDTSYTLPTTTFMSIGHRQYQYDHLGSCVARIMYYNTRLPNSQLKTLSTR